MKVKERFLKYVTYETTSNEQSESVPSMPGEKIFAAALEEELRNMGMSRVEMDENGYVYAYLPGSPGCEENAIGFIAHMDTSPAASGRDIRPRCLCYEGGDIPLENGEIIQFAQTPWMERYIGQELIVTDGRTLLGSDDKAGIAEIMTACEKLIADPTIPHRPVAVCFMPDEEIGRGTDHFDPEKFHAREAYTVDSGTLGLMEYENFNAAMAVIEVKGFSLHSGAAKNRMKNAVLLATEWIRLLPPAESPAHTEGYEGFYHVVNLQAEVSSATIRVAIRDHDQKKFAKRKEFAANITKYLNGVYGEGTFALTIKDNYLNMREKILPHMHLVDRAEEAMRAVGVEPKIIPIRGGTDGAKLSYQGIPCPNLSVGGENFHSVREFIPVPSMEKMVEVLLYLTK